MLDSVEIPLAVVVDKDERPKRVVIKFPSTVETIEDVVEIRFGTVA